MTDAEIMKGVKLCNGDLGNCKECPFDSIGKTCGIELAKAEIGLIERLQAENAALHERLEKAVEPPKPFIEQDSDGYYRVYSSRISIIRYAKQHGVYDTPEAAEARLKELDGGKSEILYSIWK